MSKSTWKELQNLMCADQYHRYKEDIALMAEMDSRLIVSLSLGQEFYLMELVKSIQRN